MMEPYERLEAAWAEFNGLDPAGMVACSSGTAALHLALEALRLPSGSEVVTGDFNMVAVPRAIAAAGLTPVFLDVRDDLNFDPNLICQFTDCQLRPTFKAIVAVHIYGRQCDAFLCNSYARTYGAVVVEDLAEAHGVRPHPESSAATWSFYANKIVAGQEGGTVWFRDPEHAALVRQLRCLGFTAAHDFRHIPRGWNHRMSNAHAELVLASLARYPENLARRREAEAWCEERCPAGWRMPPRDAPWVYDVRLPWGADNRVVVHALCEAGVPARLAFWPMHRQEEFKECRFVRKHRDDETIMVGQSDVAANQIIYLPLTPGLLSRADVERAFEVMEGLAGSARRSGGGGT